MYLHLSVKLKFKLTGEWPEECARDECLYVDSGTWEI